MKNCLVAGMTDSGKTVFSRRLVEEYGYSRIPGDALVLAFEKSFPEVGIGHDRESYESACRQFGHYLVHFMNALAWESTMPYVVDTFHTQPADLHGIDISKTTILFFGYPEADPSQKTEQSRRYYREHGGSEWLALGDEEVSAKFHMFIEMSRELCEQCVKNGFIFVDTSHDFADALAQAVLLAVSQERIYD